MTGDRERKCSKVQVQEPALRQIQSKEAVVELDTGERVVGESGGNGRGVGGGVLQKVKSVLRRMRGEVRRGVKQRKDGMWVNGLK